ncbi:DUF6507 family protein [Streptomyces sp. CA-294286]|uniref:DUF6507 family protein n=1 Tax=Streptomyces sp. CA-294286 TaxID=3240070 RepID=UPI003D90FD3C
MTAWDITSSDVRRVLEDTRRTALSMGTTGAALGKTVEGAGEAAGTVKEGAVPGDNTQGLVTSALNEYMEKRQKDFFFLALRSHASIVGARQATEAYDNGQLQMAATEQGKAFDDPDVQAALEEARKRARQ